MAEHLAFCQMLYLYSALRVAPLRIGVPRTLERGPRRCETIKLCEKPSTFVTGKSNECRSSLAQAKAIVVSE